MRAPLIVSCVCLVLAVCLARQGAAPNARARASADTQGAPFAPPSRAVANPDTPPAPPWRAATITDTPSAPQSRTASATPDTAPPARACATAGATSASRDPAGPAAAARGKAVLTAPPGRSRRPLNLVLITLDTTRADRLGCYGARNVPTPSLDRLAARGVVFENAVASAPLTLPAHCSLFTGLLPAAHGVRDNSGFRLAPERVTLAEVLKSHGYSTGGFVGAYILDRRWGIAQGFERYFDGFDIPRERAVSMESIQRRGDAVLAEALPWIAKFGAPRAASIPAGGSPVILAAEARSTRPVILAAAAGSTSPGGRGVDRPARAPFFAWIHFYDPHSPYDPPEPYATRFKGRPYDGEIAWTDSLVGRVLDTLERLDLSASTLVAVIADHGESLGEHGETGHGFFLYEPTLHVPFILAGPHPALAAARVRAVVRQVDLAPTLLELLASGEAPSRAAAADSRAHPARARRAAGDPSPKGRASTAAPMDLPATIQGRSLVPLLTGQETAPREAYSETFYPRFHFGWSELRAVRSARWRFIEAPRPELYDLADDPAEAANRAAKEPSLLARMRTVLAGIERSLGLGAAPVTPSAEDEETQAKLAALGYVGSAAAATGGKSWKDLPDPKDRIGVYNLMLQAERDSASGAAAAAIATLRKVLAQDSGIVDAWFMLARAQAAQSAWNEAAAGYRQALDRKPDHLQALLGLADALVSAGKADEAIRESRTFLKKNPGAALVHHGLGRLLFKAGGLEEAETEFSEALRLSPELAESAYDIGVLRERRQDFPGAERWFRKALALDPGYAEAHAALARRRYAAGDFKEAAAELRAAATLAPSNASFKKALEDLEQRTGGGSGR